MERYTIYERYHLAIFPEKRDWICLRASWVWLFSYSTCGIVGIALLSLPGGTFFFLFVFFLLFFVFFYLIPLLLLNIDRGLAAVVITHPFTLWICSNRRQGHVRVGLEISERDMITRI